MTPLKMLVLGDTNLAALARMPVFEESHPPIEVRVGPFDQTLQLLRNPYDKTWEFGPDIVFVWQRPEGLSAEYRKVHSLEPLDYNSLLEDVDQVSESLTRVSERCSAVWIVEPTVPASTRILGLGDSNPTFGFRRALVAMSSRLHENLAETPNVRVISPLPWLVAPEEPRLWHLSKQFFSTACLRLAASDLASFARAAWGQSRKLLVLDLDDTLWSGLVGELGPSGIRLGGHDPIGEAHQEFQREILALQRAGVLLAIVSKNDELPAMEAIRNHPEMILRPERFAAWRINWRDKATNVAEILAELELGQDAAVFIDDSPSERGRVREQLPGVLVPEWPKDKLLYPSSLRNLRCFDRDRITSEDVERTRMIQAQRERKSARESIGSEQDWLASLHLTIESEPINQANLPRAAQLLNKTNQMNMATRRMSEAQLMDFVREPNTWARAFRVSDRFGEYGLTGLVSARMSAESPHPVAQLIDFLLSCRVMGRQVEQAMLSLACEWARSQGAMQLRAGLQPTERNAPMKAFFDSLAHVEPTEAGYRIDLAAPIECPDHVTVKEF